MSITPAIATAACNIMCEKNTDFTGFTVFKERLEVYLYNVRTHKEENAMIQVHTVIDTSS